MGKILLVINDPTDRRHFADLTQSAGYDVRTAENRQEAHLIGPDFGPDLLIIDGAQNGFGAAEIATALRRVTPCLPIILISGNSAIAVNSAVLALKIDEIIPKPFNRARVLAVVGRLMPKNPGQTGEARIAVQTGPTVFIVDDDLQVRETLSLLVQASGFNVVAHASAEEFLEFHAYMSDAPACLVLDIRLNGMSGLGLQDELTQREIRTPVIFLTGFATLSTVVRAMRAGAVDFLEKPFDPEMLLATIERAIDRDANHRKKGPHNNLSRRIELLSGRERQVLTLLVAAKGTKKIAAELGIDPKTVSKHRARILEKMQVESTIELVRICPVSPS